MSKNNVLPRDYDPETRNHVVRFETWDSYNCRTKEEAIEQAKKDHGEDIDIIQVNT